MKKLLLLSTLAITLITTSCMKNTCSECYYTKGETKVRIGDKCGEDMINVVENGVTVNGINYPVDCPNYRK